MDDQPAPTPPPPGSPEFATYLLDLVQAQAARIHNLEAATVGLRDQVRDLQQRLLRAENVTDRYQRCR